MADKDVTGVTITLREIYDSVKQVDQTVRSLHTRMDGFDKDIKNIATIDERSRTAEAKATQALEKVNELQENNKWLKRAIAVVLITSAINAYVQFKPPGGVVHGSSNGTKYESNAQETQPLTIAPNGSSSGN